MIHLQPQIVSLYHISPRIFVQSMSTSPVKSGARHDCLFRSGLYKGLRDTPHFSNARV